MTYNPKQTMKKKKVLMWLSLSELEPGSTTVIKNFQLTEVSEPKTVLGSFILATQKAGSGLSICLFA